MTAAAAIVIGAPALAAVGAAFAALTGGAVAYWASRRQYSGKVQTSEAGALWVAMEGFQRNLAEEIGRVNRELQISREREDACERRLAELHAQVDGAAAALKEVGEQMVATVQATSAPLPPEAPPLAGGGS